MDVMHWGSSQEERRSHFGCDELDFVRDVALFRAIGVAAPPSLVYRWLAQLRVAPYSYDLIDNFGRKSPPHLTPGLERLAVGQRFMSIFRLHALEPERSLTIVLASPLYSRLFGDLAGTLRVDRDGSNARIVAKILVRYPRGLYGRALSVVLPTLDYIMFRKQLFTLKRYAERDALELRYPDAPGDG